MKKVTIIVIVAMGVLLCGCKAEKSEDSDSEVKELLLYCGAGIRPPADELVEIFGREYGVKVAPDYAGSEVLLSKIKLTRRGDVYMPGDKHYVEQAAQEDMVLSRRSFCYWVPTILVQKGNPKKISGLEDLLKPGIKLGLGDPGVCAISRTSKQILAKNNITWKDIEKNLIFQSLTVNWRKSLWTFLSPSKARGFLRNITTVPRLRNKTGFAAIGGDLIFKYGFGRNQILRNNLTVCRAICKYLHRKQQCN